MGSEFPIDSNVIIDVIGGRLSGSARAFLPTINLTITKSRVFCDGSAINGKVMSPRVREQLSTAGS